jgi:hypothetical protein
MFKFDGELWRAWRQIYNSHHCIRITLDRPNLDVVATIGRVLAVFGHARLAVHLVTASQIFLHCINVPFETGGFVAWTYPKASA